MEDFLQWRKGRILRRQGGSPRHRPCVAHVRGCVPPCVAQGLRSWVFSRHTRMMAARLAALCACVATVMLLVGGCAKSIACTAEGRPSFVITVLDASGTRVCDASVTVRDGTFSQVIPPGPLGDCEYSGVPERKGTYSIEVRSRTTSKTLDGVKVSADECHVHTRRVTVALDH